MDDEFRTLTERVRASLSTPQETAAHASLLALVRQGTPAAREQLARILVAPEQPLWARETAAFVLGSAKDRRAFETLVLLLNYREPARCATAARVLARLGDPRTARAAAALATNPLRTAYSLHPIRLLVELRAPESVPALVAALERQLAARDRHWAIARACVEGLGAIGDERAIPALTAAAQHIRLSAAAAAALARITGEGAVTGGGAPESAGQGGAAEKVGEARVP
ncbi:HEAT repeat domain-containing protein [Streptomyces sp. DSM 41524]|uniref:HEAT repeat domain-containing protein n=1 Tax=Streptomyces asiaticus subsp. ignotus TaxID=3098222 RepID=A0ABU7Q5H1_9ACTN|nr:MULTISPECIES: HEAT repeat domain-containing protein [Streptomyces]MBA6441336.1 HEAT repeat domain-containing protein [Streptomyces sp. GMR22]MBP8538227.1 HEAT repeat domain-containing protein [Streptomyces sp. MK37H]MEE4595899.1 HEAT repeat domain-containing protein [Streptomyces sp. DSM 41524]TMU90323.1 HEAT repeat domain-containing protein [Streptomyces sp. DASNCL29]